MTLPETLTLVRHGHSEANIIQEQLKANTIKSVPPGLFERHDANMRLAADGVQQAVVAGDWLRANGPDFDRFYVSPHIRTLETAAHLQLPTAEWRVDDRFRERSWGEIHYVRPDDFSDPLTPESKHNRDLSPFYWKPQAGESLATGVRLRVESILTSLYRKQHTQHVLAVSHGELMRTVQFVIERMTPWAWEAMDADPAYKMSNALILQYTRRDPFTKRPFYDEHFRWRRAICPWDPNQSWQGGAWQRLDHHKYDNDELLTVVGQYSNFFKGTGDADDA